MLTFKAEFKDRMMLAMDLRDVRAVDLAKHLGVTEGTISQYKKGLTSPKADRLGKMAKYLNVSPSWLMGLDVPMEREELTQLEREVITAFRACSPEMQEGICRMLGVKRAEAMGSAG